MPFIQDDAKLTLTRVATAPALIAEIAASSGRHLEVSPALGTEVLMVSVEGAKLGDVLTKLAIAATASWQPVEGGYRLVPDNAARSIEASVERARRVQAINDAIKKKADEAAKPATTANPGAAMAGAFMGGSHSADAFLPMLDVGALASMQTGDRIVFATSPTAAQRPLRGDPTRLVAAWITEHNKTAKTMSGSMAEMPEAMSGLMQGPIGDRIKRMSSPILANPTKIVVVASKGAVPFFGGDGLDIRLEVRAYGADASILIEETGNIDGNMMALIAQMTGQKPAAPVGKATPIEYSPEAKMLSESTTMSAISINAIGGQTKTPLALRNFLFNPEKHEPLSLVPGEGLAALARARRRPLVASLPDAAFPTMLGNRAPKTVEEVEDGLKTGSMRLIPDATFFVVKAADPDAAAELTSTEPP